MALKATQADNVFEFGPCKPYIIYVLILCFSINEFRTCWTRIERSICQRLISLVFFHFSLGKHFSVLDFWESQGRCRWATTFRAGQAAEDAGVLPAPVPTDSTER